MLVVCRQGGARCVEEEKEKCGGSKGGERWGSITLAVDGGVGNGRGRKVF